jgi:cobalt/nickel transport system permease protein
MSFAFVRDWRLVLASMGLSAFLFAFSGASPSGWLRRLRAPVLLMTVMTLLLSFTDGRTVLLSMGPLSLRCEGLLRSALIWGRLLAILGTAAALFASTDGWQLADGLRRCGVPRTLVDMGLLTGRYIHVTAAEYGQMRTAMMLRGGGGRSGGLPAAPVSLAGSLLVRGFERAERVHRAMILRGYSGRLPGGGWLPRTGSGDILLLVLSVSAAAALVLLELLARGIL